MCINKTYIAYEKLYRTFLIKNCIQCATAGLAYINTHAHTMRTHLLPCPSVESDGSTLQISSNLNVMVVRASVLAPYQSIVFCISLCQDFQIPLEAIHTVLLLNRVLIHFVLCHFML